MQEICVDIAVPDTYTIPGGIHFSGLGSSVAGTIVPQRLVQAQYEYYKLTMGPFALCTCQPAKESSATAMAAYFH